MRLTLALLLGLALCLPSACKAAAPRAAALEAAALEAQSLPEIRYFEIGAG